MRKLVFGFGMAQVLLTLIGTLLGHWLLAYALTSLQLPWDLGWQGAVVLGAAMAMSSTAIVVKMMAERGELESAHGQRVMGALLFQDLAVVPLLRSEEHTSELHTHSFISYAVFCLKKNNISRLEMLFLPILHF